MAFLLCGDWFLADDLVQDACTRMFSVWERVSASGSPDAYARRVIVNRFLDHRRRPSRREVPVEVLPDAQVVPSDAGEAGDRVIEALADLAPGQRAVLVLRFWEDLTIEETATVLGTSVGNVKSQSSRGLAALRTALEARGLHSLADTMRESS
jgi:RNA polymerase sigma-70 factor (sigma-E family)